MECLPRISMVGIPSKKACGPPDLTPMKECICRNYQLSANEFRDEFAEFLLTRKSACEPSVDYTGLSKLKRYYAQLQLVKGRFGSLTTGSTGVTWKWYGAFTDVPLAKNDMRFEENSILFNIGALHTSLAIREKRSDTDSMKVACTHFQCAAWALDTACDRHSIPDGTEELNSDLLRVLSLLMMAQAQECIVEKSVVDDRPANITGKLTRYLEETYEQVCVHLTQPSLITAPLSKFLKELNRRCQVKKDYYGALAAYFAGSNELTLKKQGTAIAWYQLAQLNINRAEKLAKEIKDIDVPFPLNSGPSLRDNVLFVSGVINQKLTAAIRENDFVYHEAIPCMESLEPIKSACLVKGIPFDHNDPETRGVDIFQRLVPIATLEAASVYSEHKASLLRRLTAEVDEKDLALQVFLPTLDLDPQTMLAPDPTLPQELYDACARVSNLDGGPQVFLSEELKKLDAASISVNKELQNVLLLLEKTKIRMNSVPNARGNDELRSLESRLKVVEERIKVSADALVQAKHSNSQLREAIQAHLPTLERLSTTVEELAASLPSVQALIEDPEAVKVLNSSQALYDKVDEMRRQRNNFVDQLRSTLHDDDITGDLLTSSSPPSADMFETRLKKHDHLVELLRLNLTAQKNIESAFIDLNAGFAPFAIKLRDIRKKRASEIQMLLLSGRMLDELLHKHRQGLNFYEQIKLQLNESANVLNEISERLDKAVSSSFVVTQGSPVSHFTTIPPVSPMSAQLPRPISTLGEYLASRNARPINPNFVGSPFDTRPVSTVCASAAVQPAAPLPSTPVVLHQPTRVPFSPVANFGRFPAPPPSYNSGPSNSAQAPPLQGFHYSSSSEGAITTSVHGHPFSGNVFGSHSQHLRSPHDPALNQGMFRAIQPTAIRDQIWPVHPTCNDHVYSRVNNEVPVVPYSRPPSLPQQHQGNINRPSIPPSVQNSFGLPVITSVADSPGGPPASSLPFQGGVHGLSFGAASPSVIASSAPNTLSEHVTLAPDSMLLPSSGLSSHRLGVSKGPPPASVAPSQRPTCHESPLTSTGHPLVLHPMNCPDTSTAHLTSTLPDSNVNNFPTSCTITAVPSTNTPAAGDLTPLQPHVLTKADLDAQRREERLRATYGNQPATSNLPPFLFELKRPVAHDVGQLDSAHRNVNESTEATPNHQVAVSKGASLLSKNDQRKPITAEPLSDPLVLNRFIAATENLLTWLENLNEPLSGVSPSHNNQPPKRLSTAWSRVVAASTDFSNSSLFKGKKSTQAAALCCASRNRCQDYVPYDANRVVLDSTKNDYINASHIDLSDSVGDWCPRYIVAQAPMTKTLIDFWNMIISQGCELVVLLTPPKPSGFDTHLSALMSTGSQHGEGQYGDPTDILHVPAHLPANKVGARFCIPGSSLELRLQSIKESTSDSSAHSSNEYGSTYVGQWTERLITICDQATQRTRSLIHLCFHGPILQSTTSDAGSLVETSAKHFCAFVNCVHSYYKQQRSLVHPIAVVCEYGAGLSGVFVTASVCILHAEMLGRVADVVEIAGQVCRLRRGLLHHPSHLVTAARVVAHAAVETVARRDIVVGPRRCAHNVLTLSNATATSQRSLDVSPRHNPIDTLFSDQPVNLNDLISVVNKWTVSEGESMTTLTDREDVVPVSSDNATTTVGCPAANTSLPDVTDVANTSNSDREAKEATGSATLLSVDQLVDLTGLSLSDLRKKRCSRREFESVSYHQPVHNFDDPFAQLDPILQSKLSALINNAP
ncbi:unnamed protein product [Dicrocoelium dendriticum]|nr:unnamed protein product [Dicrocoelium dendriticum]